jgi:glycerophosphoryl diester phosphodiesterase
LLRLAEDGPVPTHFDLQGHRGARGLRPENTLPSFEAAFDAGVTTVETDLHLTADGLPVLLHDPVLSERLCRLVPGAAAPDPAQRPTVAGLTLAQLRGYRADRNPDARRFPDQDATVTPLAALFAARHGLDPYTPPTLADLFAFAEAYAGELGARAGKTGAQQARARRVGFDLELKRVPFRPGLIGDGYAGDAALLERRLLEVVRDARVHDRTVVRSFDHRCVRALRRLESRLSAVALVAGTTPVAPADLVRQADAQGYGPDLEFLDERQVRELHAAGLRVIPWTVNDPADWERLLAWGVDGLTTDYPDRLAAFLQARGVALGGDSGP